MKPTPLLFPILAVALLISMAAARADDKISVLLVDGQNNHAWAQTSPVMKTVLEDCGRFTVDVCTSPPAPPRAPRKPKTKDEKKLAEFNAALKKWMHEAELLKKENAPRWDAWRPAFGDYDVVVTNYNGEMWPEPVQKAFVEYVRGGGGLVVVHAADNSFSQWDAYNEMIAVGGWGGRNEASGPYLRFRDGKFVHDMTPGRGGAHGAQHEFLVVTREPDHPIMKGLPAEWLHVKDELYGMLRGPAKNVSVLASAFSDKSLRGSGEHEPALMTIAYGEGRVFHTILGHGAFAMSGVGFQETLKRGTEWAATGAVTFDPVSAEELPRDKAAVREMAAAVE